MGGVGSVGGAEPCGRGFNVEQLGLIGTPLPSFPRSCECSMAAGELDPGGNSTTEQCVQLARSNNMTRK